MPTFKTIISDTNFPTVTMSYYITAATQVDADAFLTAQYADAPTISFVTGPTDIGASGVPQVIATGDTFTVPTNIQMPIANALLTEDDAIVLTEGTGALAWVD